MEDNRKEKLTTAARLDIRGEIDTKADYIASFAHYYLVAKAGWKCVDGSVLLPIGWKTGSNYKIEYFDAKGCKCYFTANVFGHEMLLAFFSPDGSVALTLNIGKTIPPEVDDTVIDAFWDQLEKTPNFGCIQLVKEPKFMELLESQEKEEHNRDKAARQKFKRLSVKCGIFGCCCRSHLQDILYVNRYDSTILSATTLPLILPFNFAF